MKCLDSMCPKSEECLNGRVLPGECPLDETASDEMDHLRFLEGEDVNDDSW